MTGARTITAFVIVILLVVSIIGATFYAIQLPDRPIPRGNCPVVAPLLLINDKYQQALPFLIYPLFPLEHQVDQGTGNVSWCVYNKSTKLLQESYPTNMTLGIPIPSKDGKYAVGLGFQVNSGLGVISPENQTTFLFNRDGKILWSLSDGQAVSEINGNGSVIIANDPGLLYLDNSGTILWNYTNDYASTAVALVNNGSEVVDGVSDVPFPGHSNYGSDLVLFDSHGRAIWNVSLPDALFDCTCSLDVYGGHIAAGLTYTGSNGTLSYYDLNNGSVEWSRHISAAIQQVNFEDNGSRIYMQCNYGNVTLTDTGTVLLNQTYSS